MSGWTRIYHRASDDSLSLFSGHHSLAGAIRDAEQQFCDEDVDEVWVRPGRADGTLGPPRFHLVAGQPGACAMCGWPPGAGHAPGADCGHKQLSPAHDGRKETAQ